jgi:hypothetical protein
MPSLITRALFIGSQLLLHTSGFYIFRIPPTRPSCLGEAAEHTHEGTKEAGAREAADEAGPMKIEAQSLVDTGRLL